MSQSHRIVREYKGKRIGKSVVKTLMPEDFETGEVGAKRPEKRQIGFRV